MGCASSTSSQKQENHDPDAGKIEGMQPFKGKFVDEAKSKKRRQEAKERYQALYTDSDSCSSAGSARSRGSSVSSMSVRSISRTASVSSMIMAMSPQGGGGGNNGDSSGTFLNASNLARLSPAGGGGGSTTISPSGVYSPQHGWDDDTMLYGSPADDRLDPVDDAEEASFGVKSPLQPSSSTAAAAERLRPVFVDIIEVDPDDETSMQTVEEILLTGSSPKMASSPSSPSPQTKQGSAAGWVVSRVEPSHHPKGNSYLLQPSIEVTDDCGAESEEKEGLAKKPSDLGRCWRRQETIHGLNSNALLHPPSQQDEDKRGEALCGFWLFRHGRHEQDVAAQSKLPQVLEYTLEHQPSIATQIVVVTERLFRPGTLLHSCFRRLDERRF